MRRVLLEGRQGERLKRLAYKKKDTKGRRSMPVTYSPGSSYGWRARIGLLQPTVVSDTNPFEFYLMAPPGVQLVLTSLGLVETNAENYAKAMANLETPVQRVLSRNVDAIMQSGVPPIVMNPWGFEDELRARVARLTDVPYITDVAAALAAFRALGVSRIAMAGGFDDGTVGQIADYVSHAGIEITGHARVRREGDLPGLEAVYRNARHAFRKAGNAEAVWLSPASLPTVAVIADLERDLKAPVVTSAQALLWAALQMTGIDTAEVTGYGELFARTMHSD